LVMAATVMAVAMAATVTAVAMAEVMAAAATAVAEVLKTSFHNEWLRRR
jgi:hypothetical protein